MMVFAPPQGSSYDLITLRTIPVLGWALRTYPHHKWTVRFFDDNFPIVERYLDTASIFDSSAPLAIGRIGLRSKEGRGDSLVFMGGGAPALWSAGFVDPLRRGGVDTCMAMFERSAGKTPEERPIPPLVGRGVKKINKVRAQAIDGSICGLGCEDLLLDLCVRDVLGVYYQPVHWEGFEMGPPQNLNRKALLDCKALTCRRRAPIEGRLDDPQRLPQQYVNFHYLSTADMESIERELYALKPGSREWVDLCEAAQERPECADALVAMPLPKPWAT